VTAGVFLDRDGVLVPDIGYPHNISDAEPLADVVPALLRLQSAGYVFVVVSSQSGVGRGLFSLDDVARFNAVLCDKLAREGVNLALKDFYVCPHSPDQGCDCRKPKPGLLFRAAQGHSIDLSKSFLVGDKDSDMEAALAAGVRPILLDRGKRVLSTRLTLLAADLIEAADLILGTVPGAEQRAEA